MFAFLSFRYFFVPLPSLPRRGATIAKSFTPLWVRYGIQQNLKREVHRAKWSRLLAEVLNMLLAQFNSKKKTNHFGGFIVPVHLITYKFGAKVLILIETTKF